MLRLLATATGVRPHGGLDLAGNVSESYQRSVDRLQKSTGRRAEQWITAAEFSGTAVLLQDWNKDDRRRRLLVRVLGNC